MENYSLIQLHFVIPGEVYRARDTKLEREVAIKVLPGDLAEDEERVARFEREAKLLASLNHPNIAGIYGFESGALVLEMVEGPTLAERFERGQIPIDEAIAIAKQVAEALEAGHAAGIIHRDLKPANIKLKDDGTVKVLDYGLAKALEGDAPKEADAELSHSPTLTRQGTQAGVIMGTAAYMSPEQARGASVDTRADIWAFGVVLYEMLTGTRLFDEASVSDTLAAVLRDEIDLSALPAGTPPSVRRLLRRCLERDRKRRLHHIGDGRVELDDADSPEAATSPSMEVAVWQRPVVLLGAALFLVVVSGSVASRISNEHTTAAPGVARVVIPLAEDQRVTATGFRALAISPDGSRVAYAANGQIYLRSLDESEATRITESPGGANPLFSPDGQWVGFHAEGVFQKVSVAGGAPIRLEEVPASSMSWADDDTILFTTGAMGTGGGMIFPDQGIRRVSANGGEAEVVVPPDRVDRMVLARLLPGGQALLISGMPDANGAPDVVTYSLASGEFRVLIADAYDARYVPTGHLVYWKDGGLFAVPFDANRVEVTGGAVSLVENVLAELFTGLAHFDISDTGTLVYISSAGEEQRSVAWVERSGREEALDIPPGAYTYPRLSPDGSTIALEARADDQDLWMWNVARESMTRFTVDPAIDVYPTWTSDGQTLLFASTRSGPFMIYKRSATGTGEVVSVSDQAMQIPAAVTPDGVSLLFRLVDNAGNVIRSDIGILRLADPTDTRPLLDSEFDERNPAISPDGRWLAYESNESGRQEVYVQPFPDIESGRWQVSTRGGERPLWSADGRELFYVENGKIMAVAVETDTAFSMGETTVAVAGDYYVGDEEVAARTYDVSRDGQRFLMIKEDPRGRAAARQIQVVFNWFEELKARVPTP